MTKDRVLIMGAAGRDFHNFNVYFRGNADHEAVAFTATQIPNIEDRIYPPQLAGESYPEGIRIYPESQLSTLVDELNVDQVVFAYSAVSHDYVMDKAAEVLAAGADFRLLGPKGTMLSSTLPVISVCAVRTGAGKSPTSRRVADILLALRQESGDRASPHALRNTGRPNLPAFLILRRPRPLPHHHRRARGI